MLLEYFSELLMEDFMGYTYATWLQVDRTLKIIAGFSESVHGEPNGGVSQVRTLDRIESQLSVKRSRAYQLTAIAVELGLVVRENSPGELDDRRVKYLRLTQDGVDAAREKPAA
jgi:hypothetical protein